MCWLYGTCRINKNQTLQHKQLRMCTQQVLPGRGDNLSPLLVNAQLSQTIEKGGCELQQESLQPQTIDATLVCTQQS